MAANAQAARKANHGKKGGKPRAGTPEAALGFRKFTGNPPLPRGRTGTQSRRRHLRARLHSPAPARPNSPAPHSPARRPPPQRTSPTHSRPSGAFLGEMERTLPWVPCTLLPAEGHQRVLHVGPTSDKHPDQFSDVTGTTTRPLCSGNAAAGKGCDGTITSSSSHPGILQQTISQTETVWGTPSDHRSIRTEHSHPLQPLQDGGHAFDTDGITARRVDFSNRYKGRVPAHPGTQGLQEVPPLHGGYGSVPVQDLTIWSFSSPQDLHGNAQTSVRPPVGPWNQGPRLPGRLAGQSFITAPRQPPRGGSDTATDAPRMGSELGEGGYQWHPDTDLPRAAIQARPGPCQARPQSLTI